MSATVWCSGESLSTFPGISIRVVVYCVSVKSLDRLTLEECVWFLLEVSLSPNLRHNFLGWVVVFLLVVGWCVLCVEIVV